MYLTPEKIEQFMSSVKKTNNCWIWRGYKDRDGYGRFHNKKQMLSHRISYELFKEEFPYGLTIDHLCRNRLCVNPDHLEAVSCKENILRGNGIAARNNKKTHCNNGHEFTKENTHINKNKRICRKCKRIKNKIWARNHKLKEMKVKLV